MTSTVCRAKNKATCQYHGERSQYHTRVLKNRLSVAREVYQASSSDSEKLEAFYQLQESETLYYGTDEGRTNLIEHINSTNNETARSHWLEILDRADLRREFLEKESSWAAPTPKAKPVFPSSNSREYLNNAGHRVVVLHDTFESSSTTPAKYEWDTNSGRVLFENKDDVESFRILGKAKTQEEAIKVAGDWYSLQNS